jgi:hypothetical protein
MDRRRFFQALLSAPILTPLLLASQSRESDREVYLISDTPHTHLPVLLKELFRARKEVPGSFSFCDPSPHSNNLHRVLSLNGWQFAPNPSEADLNISFRTLYQPARPSFALVKDGRIWDVRSWSLRSLWQEMAQNSAVSTFLTVASLKRKGSGREAGDIVTVFLNGHRRETFPLEENLRKSYSTHTGRITVQVTDGSARITESSCRHKICFYSQSISLSGERIICAPNHFFIEVQGGAIDTVIGSS